MARNIVFSAGALLTTSAVIYLIYLRQSLFRNLKYEETRRILNYNLLQTDNVESLPVDLFEPGKYHVATDRASKSIPRANLPQYDNHSVLLTKYLQKNMSVYAKMPQSLLLKFAYASPESKRSFQPSVIQTLDFQVGDLVCGVLRVAHRTPDKVEFAMQPLEGLPPMAGRLVISIQDHGAVFEFVTRTIQWKKSEDKFALPIERKSIAWLHELTSVWLLQTGTEWLCKLKSGS